jgi:hypothetical protein
LRKAPCQSEGVALVAGCAVDTALDALGSVRSVAHWLLADPQVNNMVAELALQRLMPIRDMHCVIKYLYYENLLAYASWTATEAESAVGRTSTVQEVKRKSSR